MEWDQSHDFDVAYIGVRGIFRRVGTLDEDLGEEGDINLIGNSETKAIVRPSRTVSVAPLP